MNKLKRGGADSGLSLFYFDFYQILCYFVKK